MMFSIFPFTQGSLFSDLEVVIMLRVRGID
jgi:hypothetical protein